jgi:dipeptidyl aminopeptidase/acylaminoacyl peptidase
VRPADLDHLAVPGDPQLHPDGVRTVYVLSEVDVEEDRYVRTIHLWDGERTRRFTHGPGDTTPRWSPDGRWLAFLRKGTDEQDRPQLHVMPADGGEAQRRTDLPLGVTDLVWAPDSHRIAVVGRSWAPEVAELDDEERARRPRRITRLPYRSDTKGWIHDVREHIWLVEATGTADPVNLTPGDVDRTAPAWHPDGEHLAFLSDPVDRPELDPHDQPFELELSGGDIRPLAAPGSWSSVDYAPDGAVYLTGLRDPFDWPGSIQLWRLDDEGEPRSVTGHLDRSVVANSPPCATVGPRFVDGGLLTALEDRGTTRLVLVCTEGWDPAGSEGPEVQDVIAGRRCVTGFGATTDLSTVVFTATDVATPGELYRKHEGAERCLTDLTRGLRTRIDIRPTERFTCERDGAELDVWAVLPEGFDRAAADSVPVLLNIHGGPTAQYGDAFFDEFQVGAGAGYLVVGTNPRGSSGRGTDWARAVVGTWEAFDSVDTLDLEAVLDATLARYPQLDADRIGVMGGSYGGYATARLLTRSTRYRSAIVERGLLTWESFSGTSDIGPYFDRMFLEASLPDGVATHRAASPVPASSTVTTPTLVLHSEHDWRCPIEQAEQYFVALKRAGVETEFVRFPDEGHELTRSGSPKHRVERFELVLEWHDRYLRDR